MKTIRQFWRDYHHDDDPFVVRLVAEDIIVGTHVRRHKHLEPRVKNDHLNDLRTGRFISALTRAKKDLFG